MNYYWTQNSSIKQLEESVPSLEILTLFITLIHYLHCITLHIRIQKAKSVKKGKRLLVVVCMDVALVPIYLYYKSDFYRDALMQIIPPLTRAHCTKWKVTWRLTLFQFSKTSIAKSNKNNIGGWRSRSLQWPVCTLTWSLKWHIYAFYFLSFMQMRNISENSWTELHAAVSINRK